MKASNLSMTSSFWFRMGDYSEIDVIEHMGNPSNRDVAMNEYRYGCNTHVYGKKRNQGYSKGNQYYMPTRGRDEFHVFGGFLTKNREFIDSLKAGKEMTSSPFGDAAKTIEVAEIIHAQALRLV